MAVHLVQLWNTKEKSIVSQKTANTDEEKVKVMAEMEKLKAIQQNGDIKVITLQRV
jgi:hypothetical protein